jgi:DNA-binding CsgD family transcriptional regulator/tetratricopeptide (TPR) repeat protein
MLTTVTSTRTAFDSDEFEKALKAADFDRCHSLVDGNPGLEVILASSRLALRERRYLDVIGLLSAFPDSSSALHAARDVFLGAALGFTRDYVAGKRLINRALNDLLPGEPLYDEAYYYKSAIAWMQHNHGEAEEATQAQLQSTDPNNRARAHIVLSWIALRRGAVLQQVKELEKAFDELDIAQVPDEYLRANALLTLALLCRELPLHEVSDRVRQIYESLPWTAGLQVTRFLAAVDELEGNELAAFGTFKKASRLAPSDHWSVFCFLDRALLARNTGETAFAAEQLQEAHEIAQRVSWNEATGEERSALLVLAQLFADANPAIAEQYLARFRSLSSNVVPMLSYGSDPRVRGFEAYSQGIAWLRLGDTQEGQNALTEAWSVFEDFDYGWRAALCALGLYEATNDKRWLERAARKIAPWPQSWIARRISAAKNASRTVVPIERIPSAKREVLELVRKGRRNTEIAEALGRSPHTVRNQVSQLFQIFDVKSRAELVAVLSKPVVPITRLAQHQRNDG